MNGCLLLRLRKKKNNISYKLPISIHIFSHTEKELKLISWDISLNSENPSKTTISLYSANQSVSQKPTEHMNWTCEVYLSKNRMRLNWIALYSDDSNSQPIEFCQCFRAVSILLVTQFTHIMAISIFICAIMCRHAINEQIYSEKWRIYVVNAMQSFLRSRGPSVHFDLKTFHIYVTRRADNEKVNYHARTCLCLIHTRVAWNSSWFNCFKVCLHEFMIS